mgnify:CR=1 FL=1
MKKTLDRLRTDNSIKDFTDSELTALCSEIRSFLVEHVSRTGGLAGCRSRRVAVDAVAVTVVLVPLMLAPFPRVGQLLFGIGLFAVFGAELLA